MTLHDDLVSLGFRYVQESRKGVLAYSLAGTRYLTHWVHWDPPASEVLYTWELDIGEFMHDRELQIGANETLNLFLFPRYDAKGTPDAAFVAQELERTEMMLASLDLSAPGSAPE